MFVTDASTTLADSATAVPLCPSDAIVSVPRCRWDPDQSGSDSHVVESRFGHFLSNAGDFDTAYFGSTAAEAVLMDPQQRLLLHQCNGPATSGRIPDAHFGVYVAISQFEYAIDVQTHGHFVAYAATGSAHSVACGRLSYTYGLSGPCASVDTACSSALVASHFLRKGVSGEECDQGIAAAVNLALSRHTNVMFVRAGMLTQDGRCKTLDAAADGYVRQEACGVIAVTNAANVSENALIARFGSNDDGAAAASPSSSSSSSSDARALCLLVSSSTVNQDGRSSSLTAPNGPSQQVLIGLALQVGGFDAGDVAVLQMHGTGTSLGDPIEIGAACDAYVQSRQSGGGGGQSGAVAGDDDRAAALILNAVKSHVGHGETAAGLMGIWQAAQGLSSLRSFPMLHLRSLNPYVASTFDRIASSSSSGGGGGVVVSSKMGGGHGGSAASSAVVHSPMQVTPLAAAGDCLQTTGISSFAFQGTNAHLLVSAPAAHPTALNHRQSTGQLWDCEWHWVTPSSHPLIDHGAISFAARGGGGRMSSGRGPVMTYHALVSPNSSPAGLSQFLDHRVNGRALFPGAGFFEMADAAVNFGRAGSSPTGMSANGEKNAPARLGGLTIPAPLILGGRGKPKSRTPSTSAATPAVLVTIDGATGVFEIVSGAGGARVTHLQGFAVNASVQPRVEQEQQIRVGFAADRIYPDAFDVVFEASSAVNGDDDAAAAAAAAASSRAAAYATMVNGVRDDANGMWMHPAALDGSLQLGFCAASTSAVASADASSSSSVALVPVGARLYDSPSQLSTRSGAAMITSVRQTSGGTAPSPSSSQSSSGGGAGVATESCHALAFSSAGFGGSHAGIQGLQSKSIGAKGGRRAPESSGYTMARQSETETGSASAVAAGAAASESPQRMEATYALVWSAASTTTATSIAAVSHAAAAPMVMRDVCCASGAASSTTTSRTRRPQRSIAGIAALQTLSTVAASCGGGGGGDGSGLMATQLRTHDAVSLGGAAPSSSSGMTAAADGESLRGAWRVTAGEFQSSATFSAVDFASTTTSSSTSATTTTTSSLTVGRGGHGVAFAGDVAYAPAALGLHRASETNNNNNNNSGSAFASSVAPPFVSCTAFIHELLHDERDGKSSSSLSSPRVRVDQGAAASGDGAVLTGGGGGLGTLMTSWLVRSASHSSVTILGRSGRSKQLDSASVRGGAAVVRVVRCDVSASDEATACAAAAATAAPGQSPKNVTLLHAGGVLADATVGNQSAGGFTSAMAPKVMGVRRVHDAWMRAGATQRVAVFSSIASLLGAAGQANYAAANGGLDRWAAAAQAAGSPSVSAQWGAWGGAGVGGMAASDPGGVLSRMRRLGFGVLAPDQGLRALERMVSGLGAVIDSASLGARRHPVVAVSPFDAAHISKVSAASPIGVIFNQLCADDAADAAAVASTDAANTSSSRSSSAASTTAANGGSRIEVVQSRDDVVAEVKHVVAELAQSFIGDDVSPEETLVGAGLDSLGAVELRNALVSKLAVTLPGTLIFDYPTVDAIADYVATLVKPRVLVAVAAAAPAHHATEYGDHQTICHHRQQQQQEQQRVVVQQPRHPFADPNESLRRVSDLVETILGEKPGDSQPLLDAGLDSLSAVELRNVLAAETGIAMPATVIFDYPCCADLATYITSAVPAAPEVSATEAAAVFTSDDDVSFDGDYNGRLSAAALRRVAVASRAAAAMFIASTSGQMPGGGGDGGGGGGDAISRTPMGRWHLDDCVVDGASKPRFSAFVADVDMFDARTFDISVPELALMDSQQRLLLVSTTESLRTAGLTSGGVYASGGSSGKFSAPVVGVYVGISSMDHQKVLDRRQSALSPFTATGGALSVAAGRIAFAHGLTGAAVAVDTACSSSLVAMQVATAAAATRSEAATSMMSATATVSPQSAACVAGVNLLQVPETTMMFQRAGMITPDGRCKTLDASADGYTRGEACASVGA